MTHICKYCHKPFDSGRRKRTYCSHRCRGLGLAKSAAARGRKGARKSALTRQSPGRAAAQDFRRYAMFALDEQVRAFLLDCARVAEAKA